MDPNHPDIRGGLRGEGGNGYSVSFVLPCKEASVSAQKLTGREKGTLLLWILAGIIGVWFAHRHFFQAFPEASVNFKVTRSDALHRATAFLSGLGQDASGYRTAVAFDVDDNAKVYLERELGLKQANQMMSTQLNIWYWDVRFFKPQQEEEFHVRVSPGGQIVGYDHVVPEAQPGGALDRQAAQAAARDFLTQKLGIDLSGWDFLPEEANSIQRPNRLDWSFTWEKRGFLAKDAPYRMRAAVLGAKPGDAQQFLKVPEAWNRDYEKLRSSNNTLETVFVVPYLLLLAVSVWYAIALTRRGQTRWGAAIKIGVVAASLLFLQNLNEWPLWGSSYNTRDPYGSFLIQQIALALLLAVVTALTISLVLPAAEPLYRNSQPDRLQLRYLLTARGFRSKEFFKALVIGLSLAAAHIGFVVAFYIVVSHYGAWAPQDLNYSDAVNTYFPWISGLAIGILASTNEEFTFRLFAIPFFEKYTKSRWIAVIVPAFLWSFLHSNYPQEPAYIRGIEVGLIGIVAGVVMLRWGILATLTWHYTVDASLVGLLLVRSDVLYFKISGIVVGAAAAVPLAIAGVLYLTRGGFIEDEAVLNRAAPKADLDLRAGGEAQEVAVTAKRYEPLGLGMIGLLAAVLVIGGLVVWKVKTPQIGDYLKVQVDAREAKARANEILRGRGLNPANYHHAASFVDVMNPAANEFLRRKIGTRALDNIYATQVPGALWSVRYFQPLNPEEYSVVLKPDGRLHSVHHTLAEAAPGASLSKEDALALAQAYLAQQKKIDLSNWTLVESRSDKKPHRVDHKLTWQGKTPLDEAGSSGEHAYARMELNVLGNEIANYRTYIKIPEDWERKQGEWGVGRVLYLTGVILFLATLAVLVLVFFFRKFRSEDAKAIPWKAMARLALWGLAGYVLLFAFGDRIAVVLQQYPTATPFKAVIGTLVIGGVIGAAFNFGMIAFVLGLAWFFCRRGFGEERIPSTRRMPRAYYRDAAWIGVCGAVGWAGLNRLLEFASAHWHTLHRATASVIGTDFDAYLPAASVTGGVLSRGLLVVGLIALIAGLLSSEIKSRWLRILIFLGGAFCLAGLNWGSPADFAKNFLAGAILLGVLVFAALRIMRFNVLGWFFAFAAATLGGGAIEMFSQPNAYYHVQGAIMLVVLAVLLFWPMLMWGRGGSEVQRMHP